MKGSDKFAWGPSQIIVIKGSPISPKKKKIDLEAKKRESQDAKQSNKELGI